MRRGELVGAAAAVALLFPGTSSSVPAQEPGTISAPAARIASGLAVGARVRVRLAGSRWSVVARIADFRPDTLVLAYPSVELQGTLPIAVSDLRKLELSSGSRTLAPVGTVAGAVLGMVLAGGYNSLVFSQCVQSCPDERFPLWLGAAIGGLSGGVGLAFVRRDRWVEIALPRTPELGR